MAKVRNYFYNLCVNVSFYNHLFTEGTVDYWLIGQDTKKGGLDLLSICYCPLQWELDVDHQFTGTEPVAIGKDPYTTVGGLFISFLVEEIAERGRDSYLFMRHVILASARSVLADGEFCISLWYNTPDSEGLRFRLWRWASAVVSSWQVFSSSLHRFYCGWRRSRLYSLSPSTRSRTPVPGWTHRMYSDNRSSCQPNIALPWNSCHLERVVLRWMAFHPFDK